jgi:hypothetical protein
MKISLSKTKAIGFCEKKKHKGQIIVEIEGKIIEQVSNFSYSEYLI